MAVRYPVERLGELAESVSVTHPMNKERLIFLNTSDILHGKILHHTYTAVNDWPGQAKKSIRKDDILFSEIRPANGRWAYVNENADDFVVSTKLMVIRTRNKRLIPRFLYHFLTGAEIKNWLQHLAESRSGTFPQITFDQVASLEIPLPPLAEQAVIADMLGTLDDKIELNRQMNETLEAIARALFKSWFVDFDPVRAKAEGRDPGIPKHIADLFPADLDDSPLGPIPRGWTVQPIGDAVRCVGGATPSTKNEAYWDGPFPFATPKDMASLTAPVLLETERGITEAGVNQISSGLLPRGTVLLSSRAPIGYLAIIEVPVAVNQGFIAMVCDGALPNYYVLNWARVNMDVIKGNANGTTFLEISKKNFRPIPAIVPPPGILAEFVRTVGPLYVQILANVTSSRSLVAIRDTLLPKLLSGEIEAPAREDIQEGAA